MPDSDRTKSDVALRNKEPFGGAVLPRCRLLAAGRNEEHRSMIGSSRSLWGVGSVAVLYNGTLSGSDDERSKKLLIQKAIGQQWIRELLQSNVSHQNVCMCTG